jgi:hydroxyacylglutathione hydrolase
LKKLNGEGPPALDGPPTIRPLPPQLFREAVEQGDAQLVDTRQMLAFGGGHIAGALNIGGRPELSVWAGEMLDAERPILLVVEDERELNRILWHFVYTGFVNFAGYLAGGMKAWENAGLPLQHLPQITVHDLHEHLDDTQVLDTRSPDEWDAGHVSGATHAYVAQLRDGLDGAADLDRGRPVTVYCDSGYRASIAASLLQSRGFTDVRNVPGSWQAWRNAGYEAHT